MSRQEKKIDIRVFGHGKKKIDIPNICFRCFLDGGGRFLGFFWEWWKFYKFPPRPPQGPLPYPNKSSV